MRKVIIDMEGGGVAWFHEFITYGPSVMAILEDANGSIFTLMIGKFHFEDKAPSIHKPIQR